jgi:hypothetical protein
MDSKWILHSKTVWVNVITALTVILALPELQKLLGPDALAITSLAQSVLNIILRVGFTSQAVVVEKKDAGK